MRTMYGTILTVVAIFAVTPAFASDTTLSPSKTACDVWLSSLYGKLPFTEYSLVDRCARALEGNTGGNARNVCGRPWFPCRAARPSSTGFDGVWSLSCLAGWLGLDNERLEWSRRAKAQAQAVEDLLWDEESGVYFDYDFVEGKYIRVLTPASFLPLYVGLATVDRAQAMAKMASRLSPGWPSVAYDEETYDPLGYWRGRTWINIAYFALRGLKWYGHREVAERGRSELLQWVLREPSNVNENYNSQTGQAAGATYFGWSSAFVIKLILDWESDRADEMPCL